MTETLKELEDTNNGIDVDFYRDLLARNKKIEEKVKEDSVYGYRLVEHFELANA